jgi:hypothetical protein
MGDYLEIQDLQFFLGGPLMGENIGVRMDDAFSAIMRRTIHNPATKAPFNTCVEEPVLQT